MRLLCGLLTANLIAHASASFEGYIYLSKSDQKSTSHPPSLSPNLARLLLAQRLGLAEYHELRNVRDTELAILNEYGGEQQALFAPQEQAEGKLLILEGIQHPGDLIDSDVSPDILIPNPPLSAATQKLAADLSTQKRHQRNTLQDQSVQYITLLQDLSRTSAKYSSILSTMRPLVRSHFQSSSSNTLLITPPFKHTSPSATYGAYTSPHILSRREAPSEEAVLSPMTATASEKDTPSTGSSDPDASFTATPLPHGILPICHPSLDSAIKATNNCSSHGTPYKKYSAGGDDDNAHDCFACRCHATVETNEDGGIKTTHWGGPACQKKDVSAAFWLLAGLTVALVGITTWGVGLLVKIGQEELPGVIGAGVAGPRAQK